MKLEEDSVWRDGIVEALRRGRKTRTLLVLMLLTPLALAIFQGVEQIAIAAIDTVIFVIIAIRFLRGPPASQLVELAQDNRVFAELRTEIQRLAAAMAVSVENVPIKINPGNVGVSPCVRAQDLPRYLGLGRSNPMIEIPVGFLHIFETDRSAALAVLAHEIAHLRHRDWELWAFSSAATGVIKWISIPFAIAFAMLSVTNIFDVWKAEIASIYASDNVRDYREFNEYLKESRSETLEGLAQMNRGLAQRNRKESATMDEKLAQAQVELRLQLILSSLGLLTPVPQLLLVMWILRLRKKSEFAADHLAALLTSPEDTAKVLTMCAGSARTCSFFSGHPSISARLAALNVRTDVNIGRAQSAPNNSRAKATRISRSVLDARLPLSVWMNCPNRIVRRQREFLLTVSFVIGAVTGSAMNWFLNSQDISSEFSNLAPPIGVVLASLLQNPFYLIEISKGLAASILIIVALRLARSTLMACLIATVLAAAAMQCIDLAGTAFIIGTAFPLSLFKLLTALPIVGIEIFVLLWIFSWALTSRSGMAAFAIGNAAAFFASWLVDMTYLGWLSEDANGTRGVLQALAECVGRQMAFLMASAVFAWRARCTQNLQTPLAAT